LVQNSSANTLLQVLDNGLVYVGTGLTGLNFSGGNTQIFNDGGSGGIISLAMGGTTYLRVFQPKNASSGITSGEINTIATPIDYGWSSGSASPNLLSLNPSINNTGTYSGTFRGIYYNPNLISLTGTNHIAIQTVTGDVLFGTTSGNVGIGSINSGWRLNVDGAIRAQRIDLTGSAGPGHVMLRIDDNGTVMRNNTFNINSGNGNAGQNANLAVGNTDTTVARLYVKGSGSTSATTSLLVQNSGGNTSLEILDDRKSTFRGVVNVTPPTITGGSEFFRVQSGNGYSALITGFENGTLGLGAGGGLIGYGNSNFSYVVASNFILNYVPTNNTNTYAISISTGFTNNGAGGTSEGAMLRFLGSTATAVGNVTLNQIEVKNTINNTGGTTINRGFYYAPTVTSVVNTQNIAFQSTSGSVNINTATIQASAILQADSTTQGFLPPRMTTAQKNAISSPANGLIVYDTDLVRPCFFNGATWITL
jgi:hypothetical protein